MSTLLLIIHELYMQFYFFGDKSKIKFNKGNASNEVSSNKMYLIIHEKKRCFYCKKLRYKIKES
jgi:thioredoxin-related protein